MNDREKLIEEVAKAMADGEHNAVGWRHHSEEEQEWYRKDAAIALAVFENSHPPRNGSCWDTAPRTIRAGECDPMPQRCELTAGHLGAHRSGLTEWMRASTAPTDQSRLIEDARAFADNGNGLNWQGRIRELADALEAVEKAYTPTDDEREAEGWREAELYASADGDARDDFMTGRRTADRTRRPEVPEPSAECLKCGVRVTDQTPSTFYTHHDETCGGPLDEPQSEPSAALEALVDAAMSTLLEPFYSWRDRMRAALRAASEAGGEGR